jgi:hypothetical protein
MRSNSPGVETPEGQGKSMDNDSVTLFAMLHSQHDITIATAYSYGASLTSLTTRDYTCISFYQISYDFISRCDYEQRNNSITLN